MKVNRTTVNAMEPNETKRSYGKHNGTECKAKKWSLTNTVSSVEELC